MTNLNLVRTYFLAAAFIAAATNVGAQSLVGSNPDGVGGSQLEITGIAPEGCVIATPTQGAITNAILTPGANSAQVRILQLADPTTAVPEAATMDMTFPVTCNTAHSLTISTLQGGLVNASPPGPGFRNRLDYQVNANWDGQHVSGTSAAPVQMSVPNAATGQLDLSIVIPAGGIPLVAGAYSDSLIVNILPAS